jgi:hypothetical protein
MSDTTAADGEAAGVSPSGPTSVMPAVVADPPGENAPREDTLGTAEAAKRVAGIVRSMRSRDAAALLEGLDDERVRRILAELSERKVAELLAGFPPERAAALVRESLPVPGGSGPVPADSAGAGSRR